MSVRLFSLQSQNPNATPAIPSSRESNADSFQNVFAQSQRIHEKNARDESVERSNARPEKAEPASSDIQKSTSDRKSENSDAGKSDVDHVASAHDDKRAATEDRLQKNSEKTDENGQADNLSANETAETSHVEPVVIDAPDPLQPTLETEFTDAALPSDEESEDALDAVIADAEVVDVENQLELAATPINQSAELTEAISTVDSSKTAAGLAPVPVDSRVSQSNSNNAIDQTASDSTADGQAMRAGVVQATAGQQASSDSEEQADASLNGSQSSVESLKVVGDNSGSFALPGATAIADSATTDATGAIPAPTVSSQSTESVVTPVPIAQPDTSELRDEANIARISRGLQSAVNQRGGNITLRLDPPELGQVRIEMEVRDGVVTARFTAQSESVRRLLMDQMGQLRGALDRQGLSIEKLDVQTASNQNHSWNSSQEDNHDGRSKGQHSQRQSHGQAGKQGTESQLDTFESQLNHAE